MAIPFRSEPGSIELGSPQRPVVSPARRRLPRYSSGARAHGEAQSPRRRAVNATMATTMRDTGPERKESGHNSQVIRPKRRIEARSGSSTRRNLTWSG